MCSNSDWNPPCKIRDGAPCEHCSELAEIDLQIEKLNSRRRDLRVKRNHVHERLLHQLPPEIASQIFTFCLPPYPSDCDYLWSDPAPLVLGAVCHTWRVRTLSTPGLWTRMSIDVLNPIFDEVNHRLSCSGSFPLSIRLYVDENIKRLRSRQRHINYFPQAYQVLLLVKQQLHRVSCLCLDLPESFIQVFTSPNCAMSMPLLQNVHFDCTNDWDRLEVKLATQLPSPSKIKATIYRLDRVWFDWEHVSQLTLENYSRDGVICLLSMAKQLSHLSVTCDDDDDDIDIPDEPIVHGTIQKLTVENGDAAKVVFAHTTMPSLAHLTIFLDEIFDMQVLSITFASFLRRSTCVLTHLELEFHDGFKSAAELVNFLCNVPALRSLYFSHVGKNEVELDKLFRNLSSQVDGPSCSHNLVLPRLHLFSYTGSPFLSYGPLFDCLGLQESPSSSSQIHCLSDVRIEITSSSKTGQVLLTREDVRRISTLRNAGKKISIYYTSDSYANSTVDLVMLALQHEIYHVFKLGAENEDNTTDSDLPSFLR